MFFFTLFVINVLDKSEFMKINSIQQQTQNRNQNFKGSFVNSATNFIAKHPMAIAGLAGFSVVAQKVVMSGSEATIGAAMDMAVGNTIAKAANEKDGRTKESSKVQAVRTAAQSIGGTATGVVVRMGCILAASALLGAAGAKAGEKGASKIASIVNPEKYNSKKDAYLFDREIKRWGKSVGGAAAICVMMVTNFLLDVPFVNFLNKKMSDKLLKNKINQNVKEAK